MTDEELGRAYGAAIGAAPEAVFERVAWSPVHFPDPVCRELEKWVYRDEGEAYAALGGSVREILRAADAVRAALAGVDMGTAGARQDFKEWVAAAIDGDFHLNDWPAKDEDGRNEAFGLVADQIVDTAYSHFRMDGES